MTFRTTEKRYWVNGHQKRGGNFHSVTASLFNWGIMVSWATGERREVTLFRLLKTAVPFAPKVITRL